MKAEKVLGIVACAVACVASVNAFADQLTWFDGNVGSTTTSAISTPTSASWNATLPDGVTPAEGSITLDNDSSTALVLTPTASSEPVLSDNVVTISSTAVLTPSDASDLGDVDGAKAGFAVGVSNDGADTNFYGYASGLTAGSRWVKLSGTVPQGENAPTTFSIVLDYRTGKKNVKFYLGNTQLTDASNSTVKEWAIDSEAAALANVSAYGSGSLTALSATCEKAVAAVGDVKYGSAAEAVIAAGTSGTVLDIDSSGEPTDQKQATNGLYAWQCDILGIAGDAAIPLQPATKEVAADKIAVAVSGYTPVDGVSVKFQVKQGESVFETKYDADAIGIPMTTGQYTVVPEIKATASN